MSFLDKILGALGGAGSAHQGVSREQVGFLREALETLDGAGSGIGARALEFVLTGEAVNVLIELQNAQQHEPHNMLGAPGRLRWYFSLWQNKPLQKTGEKSLGARAQFYASVTQDTSLDILVRLGKLLAAADAGKTLDHPGAPVPEWLQYLINDALFASANKHEAKEVDKTRPAWTIDLIARLLAHEDLDETLALQAVFERKSLDQYYHRQLAGLVDSPAVAAYMQTHREAAEALPGLLSASGRLLLAQRIGGDKQLLQSFPRLLVRLAIDSGKTVRAAAAQFLNGIDTAECLRLLGELLRDGDTSQRTQAAELLARMPGTAAREILEAAAEGEKSKTVQEALRAALSRLDAAGDADEQRLPEAPAWRPFEDTELGDDALKLLIANHRELLEKARLAAEEEIAENKTGQHKYKWRQQQYAELQKIGESDLRGAVNILNGKGSARDAERARAKGLSQIVYLGHRLQALPGFGPAHLIRGLAAFMHWRPIWADDGFQKWLGRQPEGSVDLRAIADVLQHAEISIEHVANAALRQNWNAPLAADILPPECVWPFFAERPEYIDQGLGLAAPVQNENHRGGPELGATLRTLATFPTVPARWLPRVMELALGEGKTHRSAAQAALSQLPDIGRRVIEALASSKSEVRIEAANWLVDLRHTDAIPALTRALEKENRETVRAAFLTALETLGADIAPWLAPATLLAEARKGLKARPPAGLSWFPLEALPACQWADGTAVEPDIVRWWVVLACKLKEPGGNMLLTRYLGLLDAASRQALGGLILRSFIAYDTRHPPLEEGIEYAKANAPQRWQSYQSGYQNAQPQYRQYYEANYQKTQEQVFEECKREKMAEYLGSAIGEKGILALIGHAPGHEIVTLLQQYMRDHYQRRAQIEAMLEGAAAGNDPVLIQLLLGISRRYRTASVQEKARVLVQQIADRNGWTQEQLADRTAPTAGLDDTGKLELQYGERLFTLTLDATMKPELRNPDGKVVKALPEPRQNDDPALIKEAKSQLSTSKKELKQIIELQTARLVEAMCVGRIWPQDEWHDYLYRHPIVGRLIQRLVWLELGPDGAIRNSFRPTEDGSLIDIGDDELQLQGDSKVRLAHASLVDETLADAWMAHFKDYKLTPLFPQMNRRTPAVRFLDENGHAVSEIADRQGWISDTFTLRGTFNKLGYQRAQAEDGGFFYQYFKEFSSVGVRIAIEFSGNTLPEENVPAALKTLSFENSRVRGYTDRTIPLQDVPPVLLAEAYADYLSIALACTGYDPDWEKKMPW